MKQRSFSRPFLLALCLSLTWFGVSCVSNAHFDYRHTPGTMQRFPVPICHETIGIEPFRDCRRRLENAEKLPLERGSFALGWLPILPYAWVSKAYPEKPGEHGFATLRSYWCQFDVELAVATAGSLNYSHLFSKPCVLVTPENNEETDWIFRGFLYDSTYEGERLTYGVTYLVAPLLWAVGFPNAVSHNRLSVAFQLVNRRKERVVWEYRYSGQTDTVHWLYWNTGRDVDGYPQLMKVALNAALYDLAMHWSRIEAKNRP